MDMFSPFIGVGHVLYVYHKMENFYRSAKVRESQIELSLLGILNLSLTLNRAPDALRPEPLIPQMSEPRGRVT